MESFNASIVALITMVSLIIGAFLGIYTKPTEKTNAIIMAFGVGALIQALSLELAFEGAERLLHEAHLLPITAWSWVAGGFLIGGLMYYFGNSILEKKGAALRHKATTKKFVVEKKKESFSRILKLLSKSEVIRSLPAEEMEEFIDHLHEVKFTKDHIIFNKGDEGGSLYIIEEGEIVISNPTDNIILSTLKKGNIFGEMAIVKGEPRSATAIAGTEVALLEMSKNNFDHILHKSNILRSAVDKLISERLIRNIKQAESVNEQKEWEKKAVGHISKISNAYSNAMIVSHAKQAAPYAIFLGAMLDGIPESVVIGAGFRSFSSFSFTFAIAVFLANLPEAMASSITMKKANFSNKKIFGLWGFLVFAGSISAYFGNLFLSNASPVVITTAEAIAGGGILAMVASVMMPEAFEHGGPSVGIATIVGFLTAFLFSII
ncbi:MAG: cyclic nucleotide-binding domain-containing protein [Bacteroidetes bacterium]|nr:cyclic nucleotide-binding domain-containing protein [Bacteroidota bacterium]